MATLKLDRLPDRTPVKIAITLSPALNADLQAYAALYRETYGEAEPAANLIPFMLERFLDGDRAFAKARRAGGSASSGGDTARQFRAPASTSTSPTSDTEA